jgi:hypothetical protein
VGGVVVGHEDDRAAGGAVARLGDDVVRAAVREQPPEEVPAAGDVVGDPGRGNGARAERPPRAAASPASPAAAVIRPSGTQ